MTTTSISPAAIVRPDVARERFYADSASHPGITHTMELFESTAGTIVVRCTCPAGQFPHRRPVPCRHASGVVQLLDDLGAVEPAGDLYRLTCNVGQVWADLEPSGDVDRFACGYRAGWVDALENLRWMLETMPALDVTAALADIRGPAAA